jgi:hypothetical protein
MSGHGRFVESASALVTTETSSGAVGSFDVDLGL